MTKMEEIWTGYRSARDPSRKSIDLHFGYQLTYYHKRMAVGLASPGNIIGHLLFLRGRRDSGTMPTFYPFRRFRHRERIVERIKRFSTCLEMFEYRIGLFVTRGENASSSVQVWKFVKSFFYNEIYQSDFEIL